MFYKKEKGQSTLEYVILTGFVVAALIAMGTYIKRGIQGKLRQSTDQVGEQYDPKHTTTTYTIESGQNVNEQMSYGGETITTFQGSGEKGNFEKKSGQEDVTGWQ